MFTLPTCFFTVLSLGYSFSDWMDIPLKMYYISSSFFCGQCWLCKILKLLFFFFGRYISFFSYNNLVMLCFLWYSPPGKKEEPYLTEAGREAFDKFYKLREGELQLFSNTVLQLPQLVLMKEPELVKDVLNVLIGVVSTTFSLNQVWKMFNCAS